MAYDDTKWGGFAKIIVDTTTLSVGDTVRVRSMTDSNAVYNKQVVTVGTPIIFETEIYKDYVKICLVQTINDTPTEVGGVYKTVDYGQTLFINVLDKTTLGGIQGILNAHQESFLLSIGDEVFVTEGGVQATYLISHINAYANHEVIFTRKYLTNDDIIIDNAVYTSRTNVLNYLDSLYNSFSNNDKSLIKDKTVKFSQGSSIGQIIQKVWLPSCYEVGILDTSEQNAGNITFSIFSTQASRVKTIEGGGANTWQTATSNSSSQVIVITSSGTSSGAAAGYKYRLLPCFHLVADS